MRNIYFILSIVLVILVSGCRGDDQNKLIGEWKYISHYEPGDTSIYWQFYAGDALTIYALDENRDIVGDTIKFTYSIEASVFNIYSGISGEGGNIDADFGDPRGEYNVELLKDNDFHILKQKDDTDNYVYVRIELVKQ